MPRVVTSEDLRARRGQQLDSLRAEKDVLYVSKWGRLAGVLIDVDRYADMVDRLEFLEESLAALQARDELETNLPWTKVRGS